jgi:hypothetical protein
VVLDQQTHRDRREELRVGGDGEEGLRGSAADTIPVHHGEQGRLSLSEVE